MVWDKRFVIEILFSKDVYDEFKLADEEQSKKIIARESLNALILLDKIPKKLKDFNKERFRADVAIVLKDGYSDETYILILLKLKQVFVNI